MPPPSSSSPPQPRSPSQRSTQPDAEHPRSGRASLGDGASGVGVATSRLAERLREHVDGDVLFDRFSRGRYSTDASIYQIEPLGVVVPRTVDAVKAVIGVCAEEGAPVLPRGGGTSQCGQTVGAAIVVDTSKHLDALLGVDRERRTALVRPGIVLDRLNRELKRHGLFFPVDPSTASRATIGGMAANNSSGARSIRYGTMVHNVRAIDAVLASGETLRFAEVDGDPAALPDDAYGRLVRALRAIGVRDRDEIAARFPKVLRRVGGYNLDALTADAGGRGHRDRDDRLTGSRLNLARLLVGSEGTLAFFTELELALAPIAPSKTVGVCHFARFHDAMDVTRHLVTLDPAAIELVDRTMIDLSRKIPLFQPTMAKFVRGEPDALLLVEFAGDDAETQRRKLDELDERMASLGFPNAVVRLETDADQAEMWNVRKAGLDIMTSMKGDGKPVSIIEDCAVPVEHLAPYTERLNAIFAKHGTVGTWYAHASVGCLHVRPVLNVKRADDVAKLRAIAEEAFAIVREYGGSHSGEHGDGIVRSEFHAEMYGERLVRAFEEVKDLFDPAGIMNPGKIVRAPRMDDRSLFRYKPDYAPEPIATALDWSAWPGGLVGAVEMCNNNGACRKDAGVMCPSYMVTKDEEHVTRGRANTLRLALTGQLGPDAFTSDEMHATLDLCVSCKGCRRECPTGVDMARMKIEFLHHYRRRHGLPLKERLVAHLPRYAPLASRVPWLLNLRNRVPVLRALGERVAGFSARRSLPRWHRSPFDHRAHAAGMPVVDGHAASRDVVLFVDTFATYFEPENARAAVAVLRAAGRRVIVPPLRNGRPPCCGRTFLSAGLVDEARAELRRTQVALRPFVAAGVPVVGLEPSCLLTLRDEAPALLPGAESEALAASALLFEEFLAAEATAGRLELPLHPLPQRRALLHGHCHQKAFGALPAVRRALELIPDLRVDVVDASCCGMAGSFGYDADHYEISMRMAERNLLPAMRDADLGETVLVADGASCRHQIRDGAARDALHVARVMEAALTSVR